MVAPILRCAFEECVLLQERVHILTVIETKNIGEDVKEEICDISPE